MELTEYFYFGSTTFAGDVALILITIGGEFKLAEFFVFPHFLNFSIIDFEALVFSLYTFKSFNFCPQLLVGCLSFIEFGAKLAVLLLLDFVVLFESVIGCLESLDFFPHGFKLLLHYIEAIVVLCLHFSQVRFHLLIVAHLILLI